MDSDQFKPSYLANLFKASGHPPIGSEAELVAKNGLRDPFTREGADTVCSHFVYRKIGRLTALRPIACSIETLFLAMTLSHKCNEKHTRRSTGQQDLAVFLKWPILKIFHNQRFCQGSPSLASRCTYGDSIHVCRRRYV